MKLYYIKDEDFRQIEPQKRGLKASRKCKLQEDFFFTWRGLSGIMNR
jgi:hypothetical protein